MTPLPYIYFGRLWHVVSKLTNIPYFKSNNVKIGRHVYFGRNVRFECEHVIIGDGCVFQDNVTIQATHFEVGDYGTFYTGCFVPGPGHISIGHNCWFGKDSILDASGGLTIDHNVAVAAGAQIWTHTKFGDQLKGCRFHSHFASHIGQDAWIMAQATVITTQFGAQSVLLAGGVCVKDTDDNRVYGGVPAIDMTSTFGQPFQQVTLEQRREIVEEKLKTFQSHKYFKYIKVVENSDFIEDDFLNLNIESQTYYKTKHTRLEHQIFRHLLPDIKFLPQ